MAKILIVEDNHLNMKLFIDLLEINSHEVIPSYDGVGIYDIARTQKPDLILMDIQINGQIAKRSDHITGLDLIKLLKSSKETQSIPIVVVTAFAMGNDKDRIMESGCDMYISKPVSIDHFLKVVKDYTSQTQGNTIDQIPQASLVQ